MNKISRLAAALTAAALCGCIMTQRVYGEEYGSLLVLGDSITSGYGLEGYASGDNSSAAGSFANMLSANFTGYSNLAVDGRTSAELLDALTGDDEYRAAAEDADTVVISIGGNDLLQPMISAWINEPMFDPSVLQGIADGSIDPQDAAAGLQDTMMQAMLDAVSNVDLDATAANIAAITAEITELNPNAQIYILTVYNPLESISEISGEMSGAAAEIIPVLNEGITAAAAPYDNVNVVDVYSAFEGHSIEYTNIGRMDIHPNAAGHNLIYRLLCEAMNIEYSPAAEDTDAAATAAVTTENASTEILSETDYAAADSNIPPQTGNTSAAVPAAVAAIALGCALSAKIFLPKIK